MCESDLRALTKGDDDGLVVLLLLFLGLTGMSNWGAVVVLGSRKKGLRLVVTKVSV